MLMRLLLPLCLALAPTSLHAADLGSFISGQCMDCHDNETKKGGFSLESLTPAIDSTNAATWLKVLQQTERYTMPPPERKQQPSIEERDAAVRELEAKLVAQARNQPSHPATVMRRLNRTEYRLTLRDMLHLNVSSFDPAREFPEDNRVHGFASNGEKLVTSGFLLRQYVEAAEQVVARTVHFEPKPEVRHWDLHPPFDRTTRGFVRAEASYYQKILHQEPPYQSIIERMRGMPEGGYLPVDELRGCAPAGGWYRIRIQAQAKFHDAELDPKDPMLDLRKAKFPSMWDPADPIRLALFTGSLEGMDPDNQEALAVAATSVQPGQRQLAVWDLPNDELTWLECRVWLDRGQFPRMGFPNGPSDSNNRLRNYFKDNQERLLNPEQKARYEANKKDESNLFSWFESPRIRVSRIEVEGPLQEEWPPAGHRAIFGDAVYHSNDAPAALKRFAALAWRRPVQPGEVEPQVKLVRAAEQSGMAPELAIQEGIKSLLCSPAFLYREEKGPALDAYELASRLSYFLWCSLPDETLMGLAASGQLLRPEVLHQQALRLLADPRSDAFVEEFLNGWLALRKLGTMAPDVRKFANYYDDRLEPAMRTETRLYFQQLLNTNGPITRLLDSDFTFVNKELAKLYSIDPAAVARARSTPVEGLRPADLVPDGDGHAPSLAFVPVKLADARRGGLLGQASVLTLTANGVDTSPVIRGVWLLENILGATPSPPPPNVPSIEPDIRGAHTIRDQLAKHQASATCRSCHHVIDPPGFALENFDAIGHWRGHYMNEKSAVPVDASGQFGGMAFKDITGFKAALIHHREQFARCLVEKLLIDALGRELEVTDRPAIRQIVDTAAKKDFPLRDLVVLCVESELFRRK